MRIYNNEPENSETGVGSVCLQLGKITEFCVEFQILLSRDSKNRPYVIFMP
jgi:hypothetical protein